MTGPTVAAEPAAPTAAEEWATGAEPVLRLAGVTRSFPGEVHALRGIDLDVEPGEHVSIVGASGSGKSTLLNILGLLDRPTTGSYRIAGVEAGGLDETARAALRAELLGFVFQSFHLLPHRTVLENVVLATLYRGVPRADRAARAEQALVRVGMAHRLGFRPGTLSGGESQRVAIARALVTEPSLLLCDEPTGNLDSVTTASILDVFDELHAGGLTVVVVTHEGAVSDRAQRVVEVLDGHIVDERRR